MTRIIITLAVFMVAILGILFFPTTPHSVEPMFAGLTGAKLGGAAPLAFFGATMVTSALLKTMSNAFSTVFRKAYAATECELMVIAMTVKSTGKKVTYGWVKNMPALQKWIGDRIVNNLSTGDYTITNEAYAATVAVDRDDIEDDELGLYEPTIKEMAAAAKRHPGLLLAATLKSGETKVGPDTVEFFHTDHPNGKQAKWSNLLTGAPLNAENYKTARSMMMSYVNDQGESLGIRPDLLVVPPQLEQIALDLVKADRSANGATNTFKGTAEVLVVPELATHPAEWYLACNNREVKPLVYQHRRDPEFVAQDEPTDHNAFTRKEYQYGVDYRGATGFGIPHLIIKGREAA